MQNAKQITLGKIYITTNCYLFLHFTPFDIYYLTLFFIEIMHMLILSNVLKILLLENCIIFSLFQLCLLSAGIYLVNS